MEKSCIICASIDGSPENDIRHRKVEGKPVVVVIEELFGLRINAADRCGRGLPHKICPTCVKDLTTAYNLRTDLWHMEELVAEWEIKNEADEVHSVDAVHTKGPSPREETFIECPIDIKEEPTLDRHVDHSTLQNSHDVESFAEQKPFQNQTMHDLKQLNVVQCEGIPTEERFTCRICQKTFNFEEKLQKHLLSTHTNERPPGTSNAVPEVKKHRIVPTQGEKFPCGICGKSFDLKRNLNAHLQTHSDEKPHECQICHKKFKRPHEVKQHQIVHSLDKKFTCDICGKTFRAKTHIARHLTEVHRDNQLSCDICNRLLKNKHSLQNHLQIVHGKDKQHECKVCHLKFMRPFELTRHQKIHNEERKFPCDTCGKTFKYNHHILRHMKNVHGLQN